MYFEWQNMQEFFTLMEICNLSVLGDYNSFKSKYIVPIDRGKYRNSQDEAKTAAYQALAVSTF